MPSEENRLLSRKKQIFADETKNICLLLTDLELHGSVLGDGVREIRVTTGSGDRVWRMSKNVKILNIP